MCDRQRLTPSPLLEQPRGLLYKGSPMLRSMLCLLIVAGCLVSNAQINKDSDAAQSLSARTAGLQKQDGFLPYYWDAKKGMVLFELSSSARDREFLYFVGMGSGVGSIKLFADRGTIGGGVVCSFRRIGPRVLMIAENSAFRAERGSQDLKHSVELSSPPRC